MTDVKKKTIAVVLATLSGFAFLPSLSPSLFAGEKTAVPSASFAGADLKMEPCRVSAECINRVWPGKQREAWRAKDAWFVNFDVTRPGTLTLRLPGAFKRIRPLSRTAAAAVTNGVLYTAVTDSERFVVEAGGTEVHVFANPPFVHERVPGEIYFGPGEHDAGLISPTNGQTVCIDAGARVYGSILMQGVRDVKIVGRGVLDSSRMTRTRIEDPLLDNQLRIARGEARWDVDSSSFTAIACTNLVVSGITIVDAPFYAVLLRNECKGVAIDHVKLVGNWRYNSDGFDVCASEDVTIRHSFARTFDDCVVARGLISFGRVATLRNLLVEDCELWCDWGKNLEVWAGPQPTLIENVTYRNCKALNVTGDACDVTTWECSEDTRFRNIAMDGIEIDLPEPITPMQFQTRDDEPWVGRTSHTVSVFRVDCRLPYGNAARLKKTRVDYRDIRLSNVRIYGDGAFVTETYLMPDELPYYRAVNVKVEPFERIPASARSVVFKVLPWGEGTRARVYVDRRD